jgi:hypothetical protein
MNDTQAIATLDELRVIATHPLTRLIFNWTYERWLFAEYFMFMQNKSETLLSLLDTIEHWRTTPYDVLFEEMKGWSL